MYSRPPITGILCFPLWRDRELAVKIEYRVQYDITPMWAMIRQSHETVLKLLAEPYPHLNGAAATVASELLENAVKYGGGHIDFRCEVVDDHVVITAINSVADHSDVESMKRHIDRIRAAADPFDLYVERLTMLMENPEAKQTQLGLYRIAYEARFTLAYAQHGEYVEVKASRSVHKP